LLKGYDEATAINVGTGVDLEIRELASRIAQVTDYQGQIKWDTSKPDGTPQKLLDVTRINKLGWTSEITLDQGLKMTYEWFVDALATENLR
jgi:GDP-L-fucose synthase